MHFRQPWIETSFLLPNLVWWSVHSDSVSVPNILTDTARLNIISMRKNCMGFLWLPPSKQIFLSRQKIFWSTILLWFHHEPVLRLVSYIYFVLLLVETKYFEYDMNSNRGRLGGAGDLARRKLAQRSLHNLCGQIVVIKHFSKSIWI